LAGRTLLLLKLYKH